MTVPGPPVLDIRDAVEAAAALRRRLGVPGDEPLPCVMRLAEHELDLDVVVARLPENCSGFYLPREHRGLVATNGLHAVVRQRFTVAHEIGHHVLGHGAAPRVVALAETPSAVESPVGPTVGEAGATRDGAEATDPPAPGELPATAPVPAAPRRTTDPRERAANAFAAELLCPAHAARTFVERHGVSAADGPPRIDFDLVVSMSCAFGLSAWAILMRLGTSKVLTDDVLRAELQARVDRSEHIPRYRELGLSALEDELQEIARTGILPRLPEGVGGDVVLSVTDPERPTGPLPIPPAVLELRQLLGLDVPV
jgi:Zn-dependent peptidase ImmA (M78 family)